MIIFLFGALLATLGTDIDTVLAGRGLQGLGAGAAPVVGRAILRDTHAGSALARALALSMAIFAVGPICAPLLGYAVVELSSWRGIFGLTGIAALALLLFDLFRYRETNVSPDRACFKAAQFMACRQNHYGASSIVIFSVLRNGCILRALHVHFQCAPHLRSGIWCRWISGSQCCLPYAVLVSFSVKLPIEHYCHALEYSFSLRISLAQSSFSPAAASDC